ncbi:uncharacterized protein N0V89_005157 [Didymosphaeria variabile]|uniref:Uncharacterized protein n=1 Tax=Didymosphaeria variabile TaxID=1932322 RepID=A0A9W8XLN8_9PLEO|nr:uncharacterized protein N0V89_005157 [Didymosphaeria variabile]KAJ4353428.1 hypothetical protein N0V89_005157 [Didymosphaeria variabile]
MPRYLQSCKELDRVRQRQARLADALNDHIPSLEAQFKLAVERLDSWLGKLKAQQDAAKADTDRALKDFYQKTLLVYKGLLLGEDQEVYEAYARDSTEKAKPKKYQKLEEDLRRLQAQRSDAQDKKRVYLRFLIVLQTGKDFAERRKVTEDDEASQAETRLAQIYLEELEAFTQDQEERAQTRELLHSLARPTTSAGGQVSVNEDDLATRQPQSRPEPNDATADANLSVIST